MSVVSKPTTALHRKRLAGALAAVSLCMLVGACGNDDHASDPSTTSATDAAADNGGSSQVLSANPSASPAASALPALTIQTPALPASSADAALSAAASTPLAPPVIHTVD